MTGQPCHDLGVTMSEVSANLCEEEETKFMNRVVELSVSLKPMCLPDQCWFSPFYIELYIQISLHMRTHNAILLYSCVGGLDEIV